MPTAPEPTMHDRRRFRPGLEAVEPRLSLSRLGASSRPHPHRPPAPHGRAVVLHARAVHVRHRTVGGGHAAIAVLAPIAAAPAPNQAVVAAATAMVGTTVGNGQCTALAVAALQAAGAVARPSNDTPDGDYGWGQLVATLTPQAHSLAGVAPGDIVQFRDAYEVDLRPGGSYTWQTAPHHTAVVVGVVGDTLEVLQQNFNDVQVVQAGAWDLDGLQAGTLWVYRPVPA
jgi:hypothetical protein